MKTKPLYKIDVQGAAVVNTVTIHARTKAIVCIDIDMKSKYCQPGAYCNDMKNGKTIPGIFIDTDENSLFVRKSENDTLIMFPMFEGYSVYASSGGRYTISVVLINNLLQ